MSRWRRWSPTGPRTQSECSKPTKRCKRRPESDGLEAGKTRLRSRRTPREVSRRARKAHGQPETERARLAAEGLFGVDPPTGEVLEALRGIVPETSVTAGDLAGEESLVDVLVASGLCGSRGDARRTLAGGGVSVNGVRQDSDAMALPADALVDGRFVLLQKGRRNRHLLVLV